MCQVYSAVWCVPSATGVCQVCTADWCVTSGNSMPGIHCNLVCIICYRCVPGIHCSLVCTICYQCARYTLQSGVYHLLPVCQVYSAVWCVPSSTGVPGIHCSQNDVPGIREPATLFLKPACPLSKSRKVISKPRSTIYRTVVEEGLPHRPSFWKYGLSPASCTCAQQLDRTASPHAPRHPVTDVLRNAEQETRCR